MRQKIWKIFRLPSPKELGMTDSEYAALPMRDFQNAGDTSPCWEDWAEKVKKEYPIRYFFFEELVPWIKCKYRRLISDPWYWLICHTLPSRKYHWLDLRQPKDDPLAYRYGWLDTDNQMVYALFNILNNFVKQETLHWYCPSEEDVQAEPHLLYQRNEYLEVKAIHYWWNIERKRQEKADTVLLERWHQAKKERHSTEHQLWNDLQKADVAREEKLEEMISRLIKIRRSMWT